MIRITDFAQRKHNDPDSDCDIYEMIMGNGFRHDVKAFELGEITSEQAKSLPNEIMNKLTESWNDHLYGDILRAMEVLRIAIIDNAKAIDTTGEEAIRESYTDVMNLCQIQPPEKKSLIQVPGERDIHRVN